MKTAIVYGSAGQSGSFLCELLLAKGYKTIGAIRRNSTPNLNNLTECIKNSNFSIEKVDITDAFSVFSVNNKYRPSEMYNLACQSHVGSSFSTPSSTIDVSVSGSLNCLEWLRQNKNCRYYFAASSELFGSSFDRDPITRERFQDEDTTMSPNSPYAIGKLAGFNLTRMYRESYNLHASSGVCFNHESRRRSDDFVTQKIIKYAVNQPYRQPLKLGNINAYRDWSHAKDIVRAMWLILQKDAPDDYVIGSGQTHSIHDFIKCVSKKLDVIIPYTDNNQEFNRPNDVPYLRANPSKAKQVLGWSPEITFEEMIDDMIEGAREQYVLSC